MATSWQRVSTQGLLAGGIGYLTSGLFYALLNLLNGDSLFQTPALLGSLLFYGISDVAAVTVSAGPVIAFNGLYLLLYLAIGAILALLADAADHGPHLLYLAVLVLIVGVLELVGAAVVLARIFDDALPAWTVIISGLLALAAMIGFLYHEHPAFQKEMREDAEMPEAEVEAAT